MTNSKLKAFAQQRNSQQTKTQPKQCDWQGLNFQNISTAHTNQLKKRKIGRRPE